MKLLRIIIVFVLFSNLSFAQSRATKVAFEIFDNLEYDTAINLLKDAYTKEQDQRYKAEILFRLGECYKNKANYKEAKNQYERAMSLDYGPEAEYNYGKMLQMQGDYDEAELVLKEYLEESPSDERVTGLLKAISMAKKMESEKTDYRVSNLKELNTPYHDFAPSFDNESLSLNSLVFTSTRLSGTSTKEDKWLGTGFSDLYFTKLERKGNDNLAEKSKWSQPVGFSKTLNSNLHEGVATFSRDGKEVFFTRCDFDEENESGCGIFTSRLVNGEWTDPVPLIDFEGGKVSAHPALSPDGKTLVFSANGPDSYGKNDLYFIKRNSDGTWSDEAKNLGRRINTEMDEMYPWIDQKGNLYFASDGHEGLGGLDVFYAPLTTRSWGIPVNMKTPLNSPADDFGLIFSEDKSIGYFSSNRNGGLGMDDIYEIRLLPFLYSLQGFVIDAKTGEKLPGVQLKIEGNDGSISFTQSNEDGSYLFDKNVIKGETSYKLLLKKSKYIAQIASFSTLGIPVEQFESVDEGYLAVSNLDIEMDHIADPVILPRIEYDFNKATLRPEARRSLQDLVSVLEENPDIVISLRSHTDHIGNDEFNINLSQERAQSCVDFLISKGVDPNRLKAEGMGESEPFIIPKYFESSFEEGQVLTEQFISKLSKEKEEEARQYNRRTDFKVLGEIVRRTVAEPDNDSIVDNTILVEIDTTETRAEVIEEEIEEKVEFYELKDGDNFGSVASQFNISVKDLRDLNGGLRATQPFTGLKLKVSLTADYTEFDSKHYRLQRKDNTFEKLLESSGLGEDEFFELNPDFIEDDLRAGTLIVIKN